jgi:hypothetical protein
MENDASLKISSTVVVQWITTVRKMRTTVQRHRWPHAYDLKVDMLATGLKKGNTTFSLVCACVCGEVYSSHSSSNGRIALPITEERKWEQKAVDDCQAHAW